MHRLLTALFFLAAVLPAAAQTPASTAGTAGNVFLRSGLSARVAGMGETFTAVADDENALFYNPAGLANIGKGAVGLNHTQWFEDIRMDNLIAGYNFDRKLGVALSVAHMWMPALEGKDVFGNPTGDVNVSSSVINLGLGYKIHPAFYVGLGVKYFQDNLAGFSASGLALDAGFYMYTALRGLSFGFAVQNIGGDIQYDEAREELPLTYRAGLAYKVPGTDLRIAADASKSLDTDYNFSAGVEYVLMNTFSLRVGNQFKNNMGFQPGYGAGFNFEQSYALDYTFHQFEDLGNTHRVGFTFRFDLPDRKIRTRPLYREYGIKRLNPPDQISYSVSDDKLIVNWGKVDGAVYNIYARVSADGPWKKLNKSLVHGTSYVFKKPSSDVELYISLTSVLNSVESDFSGEVKVDVQ